MSRASQLGPDQIRKIDHFVASLCVCFPEALGVAHVGSSLTSPEYRDVDLRVILDDEHHERLASSITLADLNMMLSEWGRQVTRLPIDCQVQPQAAHSDTPRHNWRGRGVAQDRSN